MTLENQITDNDKVPASTEKTRETEEAKTMGTTEDKRFTVIEQTEAELLCYLAWVHSLWLGLPSTRSIVSSIVKAFISLCLWSQDCVKKTKDTNSSLSGCVCCRSCQQAKTLPSITEYKVETPEDCLLPSVPLLPPPPPPSSTTTSSTTTSSTTSSTTQFST
ncbi:unnamed protein product [Ranitomeya imitator]|uniref:Uncharacterized protein n=1 Tax=Ranitomeya imitator TaxID=111125 RepID=A0ABN9M374_9NEOB|nr:unnamed protein product [Ranitomeya imitator]